MYQDFKTPVFLIQGSVFLSIVKRLIKKNVDVLKLSASLRPPNQFYAKEKFYGGLPSGHMSQSVFCLTLSALRCSYPLTLC